MASKTPHVPSSISILLSRSTIYLKVAQGSFPKPINLGPRAVGWVASEIDAWLQQQLSASRVATS